MERRQTSLHHGTPGNDTVVTYWSFLPGLTDPRLGAREVNNPEMPVGTGRPESPNQSLPPPAKGSGKGSGKGQPCKTENSWTVMLYPRQSSQKQNVGSSLTCTSQGQVKSQESTVTGLRGTQIPHWGGVREAE